MRILTVLLLKEREDGSAAPVPPSDTTCTHKIEEEKKGKLGCESGKERGERRRREEQDKEEEEKREEEGAEHPMHAPTGAQIKK